MQKTMVLLKPDTFQRGLVGEIISRLEKRGLKLLGIKMTSVTRALARQHYAAHIEKDFYESLESFITSGPVIAMVWEGKNAIEVVRATMGVTNPADAAPGTIRGDLATDTGRNLIHGSDSESAANREIELFFSANELIDCQRDVDRWITES